MKYRCGDEIEVRIDRDALGQDQGVAHLPDETMVIVVGAGGKVGENVQATIIGVQQTPVGCSFLANAKL